MKEKTKARIKKAIKIGALVVLAAFATFGAVCAVALAVQGGSQAQTSSVARLPPRKAPEESVEESAYQTTYQDVFIDRSSDGYSAVYSVGQSMIRCDALKAGLWYIAYDRVNGNPRWLKGERSIGNVLAQVSSSHENASLSAYNIQQQYISTTPIVGSWVYIQEGQLAYQSTWYFRSSPTNPAVIRFAYAGDCPAQETFTLPMNWNPYQIVGGVPSAVHDGTFTDAVAGANYNALLFRSNGYYYNSMTFTLSSMADKYVGWYDANGRLQAKKITSADSYIITGVTFSLQGYAGIPQGAPQTALVMSVPIVMTEIDGQSVNVYMVSASHDWYADTYRRIEVVDVLAEQWTPASYVMPQDSLSWLESTYADMTRFDPNSWGDPNMNANVFDLIASAFSAVMPFLGTQLFPSLTIGMLIILPLIGGIVVLIIKAVTK